MVTVCSRHQLIPWFCDLRETGKLGGISRMASITFLICRVNRRNGKHDLITADLEMPASLMKKSKSDALVD